MGRSAIKKSQTTHQPRFVIDEHGGKGGVLVDMEEYSRLKEAANELESLKRPGKKDSKYRRMRYSFSDLSGLLTWKGDPVAEQRRLRNECEVQSEKCGVQSAE